MLTWMSWVSHWSATASTPMRGIPTASPSSHTQTLTDSRISGSSGLLGEDELALGVEPTGQVHGHRVVSSPIQPGRRAV